jgi:MFS family permease
VTAAQVGYATGLILLVPLGDVIEGRRLATALSILTGLALFVLAASPSKAYLFPAVFLVGGLSVLAQLLVPYAASLAADRERGQVVGMVMSGLLIGVLLARTFSGLLAEVHGWRLVYWVAGSLMLVQAAVLRRRLPPWHEATGLDYPRAVGSVLGLLREEPVLRLRALYGLMSFGTFGVLWTSLALLLASHYHYPSGVIGLFGLAGAVGLLPPQSLVACRTADGRTAPPASPGSCCSVLGLPCGQDRANWSFSSSAFSSSISARTESTSPIKVRSTDSVPRPGAAHLCLHVPLLRGRLGGLGPVGNGLWNCRLGWSVCCGCGLLRRCSGTLANHACSSRRSIDREDCYDGRMIARKRASNSINSISPSRGRPGAQQPACWAVSAR